MEYQPIVIALVLSIIAYLVLSNMDVSTRGRDEIPKKMSAASKGALFFFLVIIFMVVSHLGWSMLSSGISGGGGGGSNASLAAITGELPLPDYCVGSLTENLHVGSAPF